MGVPVVLAAGRAVWTAVPPRKRDSCCICVCCLGVMGILNRNDGQLTAKPGTIT